MKLLMNKKILSKLIKKIIKKQFMINIFMKEKNNIKNVKNGQSTIEFILLTPFLIIICFAVFQLGYVIYLQNNLENVTHEVARVISTTNSNIAGEEILDKRSYLYRNSRIEININPMKEENRKIGDILGVNISIFYSGFGDLINKVFGKPIKISSQASMRMECE